MKHRKLTFDDHKTSDFNYPVCVLADNITLKENIGSLFRLCDALAIEHLYLSRSTDLSNDSKLSKVSRNTVNNVSHSITQSPLKTIEQLKQNGYAIISLELTTKSIKIQEFDFSIGIAEKICLILGNESKGISDELLEVSDHCVHIPMLGTNSSMNVISAAAIALFEITRNMPEIT